MAFVGNNKTLLEHFRSFHKGYPIKGGKLEDFCAHMQVTSLDYFGLTKDNFTPQELVSFNAEIKYLCEMIGRKLRNPKVKNGNVAQMYSRDKSGGEGFFEKSVKFYATHQVNRTAIEENDKPDIPMCSCAPTTDNYGPFYTHMGIFESISSVRKWVISCGYLKNDIRIEKITFRNHAEYSENGCPQPKDIIRRGNEKILVTVKERTGHSCPFSIIIVQILIYDAFAEGLAESYYERLTPIVGVHGIEWPRGCAKNKTKDCNCTGEGYSVSFGCQKHKAYPACKWCKSMDANIVQYQLMDTATSEANAELQSVLEEICTLTVPLQERLLFSSFQNMIAFENESSCRIQSGQHQPWTGVSCVSDFCAHSHTNVNNSRHGHTTVYTLTKPDATEVQYHILPHYILADVDEDGSFEKQQEKEHNGLIEKRPCQGGLAIAPPKNSLLMEAAKYEVHCTTSLSHPNRLNPSRMGIVMYQHANLHRSGHGNLYVQEHYS